jgi:hypothetical protein
MSIPQIEKRPGGFRYIYTDEGVAINTTHIYQHSDGRVTGELLFQKLNGAEPIFLRREQINFLAGRSLDSLAKALAEEYSFQGVQWNNIIKQIAHYSIEAARKGEEVIEVWPRDDDTLDVDYLLKPLLYLNNPTILFGDGSSLKSLMALASAYIVQLPMHDNPLGFETLDNPTRVLYLDYEDTGDNFRKRLSALRQGMGVTIPILYRHMATPLSLAVEQLQQIKNDYDIGLVIVDSLGPAAGGNLNDPQPAIIYHTALRELNVTSLTIAHNSKDPLTKKRSIFGSVFFSNLARSVWECKAEQRPDENETIISLRNHKANLSILQRTMGFRVAFSSNTIDIAQVDLSQTSLSVELPLPVRILSALREGAMPLDQLADVLDAKKDSVRISLYRLQSQNSVIKLGKDWGLAL